MSSSSSSRTFIPIQEQTHVVIDLETLATSPDAVVISIGVAWGKDTAFCGAQWNLEGVSQLLKGRKADQSTMDWWAKQPPATQKLAVENPVSVEKALQDLSELLCNLQTESGNYFAIWGNAPSFDLSILASLYRQYGMEVPWKYWQERDLRTFGACVGADYKSWESPASSQVRIPHCAKHDATHELEFILAHYDRCQS